MHWKIPDRTPPKSGDVRRRKIFAWKPTKVNDYKVWLEYYEMKEHYFEPSSGVPGWWSESSRSLLMDY